MTESDDRKLKTSLDGLLSAAKKREGATNALALLFPKIERALHTYIPENASILERRRQRRISQRDFTENYFALSPQAASWGQSEFKAAIKGTAHAAFDALNIKISQTPLQHQSDVRRVFIELLDAEFRSGRSLTDEWLKAIVEESSGLLTKKDEQPGLFSVENEDRLRWLIINALEKLPIEERATILKSAIQDAPDLTVLADVVRSMAEDLHPDGAKSEPKKQLLGDYAGDVRNLLLSRVRQLAQANEIWTQAKPASILWFWWGTDNESEVRDFTQKAMTTPSGLRA